MTDARAGAGGRRHDVDAAAALVPDGALTHAGAMTAVLSFYASTPNAFTDDPARLLTLLAPGAIHALPKVDAWTQSAAEPRRMAVGELRLQKR